MEGRGGGDQGREGHAGIRGVQEGCSRARQQAESGGAGMIVYTDPQGSEAWHEARRGVITGSRFKDCRDYNQPTAAEKKEGATRGKPSKKLLDYAMDVARGRVGG